MAEYKTVKDQALLPLPSFVSFEFPGTFNFIYDPKISQNRRVFEQRNVETKY